MLNYNELFNEDEILSSIMTIENNCIKCIQDYEKVKKQYLFDLMALNVSMIRNYKHLIKCYGLFKTTKIEKRIEEDVKFIDSKLEEWGEE